MGLYEKDPRDRGYMALYLVTQWFQDISADTAIRIINGSSHVKPGQRLTPEIFEQIKKVIQSPNFTNINSVVRKFRVNKYEIYEALAKEKYGESKNADEGVITISQIDILLMKLKGKAENCNAGSCEKCALNSCTLGQATLCEMLCDMEFDASGKPVRVEKKGLKKIKINYNSLGDTKIKAFELYREVAEEFENHIKSHKDKKVRDIASAAIAEYLERHA